MKDEKTDRGAELIARISRELLGIKAVVMDMQGVTASVTVSGIKDLDGYDLRLTIGRNLNGDDDASD